MSARPGDDVVLEVEDLRVRFGGRTRKTRRGAVGDALGGVGLTVARGEIVGVIGETGSGKTTLARAILGLAPVLDGSVRLDGRPLTGLDESERRKVRRDGGIQLVFQDPLRSLDPDLTVERSVGEGLEIRGVGPIERRARVRRAIELVGLDPVLLDRRPGEISGGQRQRVAIARAVVLEPRVLICDEPVSALDASTRNAILRMLLDLRRELDLALIVISHDLASLAGIADRVAVLYRGKIVEQGPIGAVFSSPRHPYTALLVASAPHASRARLGFDLEPAQLRRSDRDRTAPTTGCVFAPRCRFASAICATEPPLTAVGPGRAAACHHHESWPREAGAEAPVDALVDPSLH
jgi:oligopeptide/dipeptide ABC transporter ATP-binding protein